MFVLIILSANTSNKMIEFFIKLHVSCLAGFIVELPHTKCAQQSPIALCWDGTKTVAKTYRISLSFSSALRCYPKTSRLITYIFSISKVCKFEITLAIWKLTRIPCKVSAAPVQFLLKRLKLLRRRRQWECHWKNVLAFFETFLILKQLKQGRLA